MQVASTAASATSVWPVAGIASCFFKISSHVLQWLPSVSPSFVQVASTAASTTSVWPVAGIASCFLRTSPHALQWLPSVHPLSLQVASVPASTTFMWPVAGMTSCFFKISSHILQWLPSVSPSFVHVASTAASTISTSPNAGCILKYSRPQFLQTQRITPTLIQVVAKLTPCSSQSWPNAGISSRPDKVAPHCSQYVPSCLPLFSQVGDTIGV